MTTNISSSHLLTKLNEKRGESTFSDDLYTVFCQFSYKVNQELKQINQLFDEYTPHDDTHMQSLFRIADELLGDVINSLNGIELCILACAMYGHDWGMAISQDEKELIVTGKLPKDRKKEDFALLEAEAEVWSKYAKTIGVGSEENIYVDNHHLIGINDWREYVRQTHAQRALFRVKHYFANNRDLESLGPILGLVCEAHWYDISRIKTLPIKSSIGGKVVNLRALAIYTRFIDLLDIGNNRTPFALRIFINPRDPISSIEWKKHQALTPVTFTNNHAENDRLLHFHGSTDNHIVYAALQDLGRYCKNQIEENVDELKSLINYSLGDIKLDWDIKAINFEPIDIRFEFDRKSMFDLVGGEIYDGDPYVFIRELLQNSIDAISLRKSICRQNGTDILNPLISIDVSHLNNGDAKITIVDCGIGMSINVVRNYLATIGKSYYRSKEFNDLNSGMKSISRFGVGLISCFEVSDAIQIETETDGHTLPNETLLINIFDKNQQFRVQKKTPKNRPGTKITLNIIGDKWRKNSFSSHTKLSITDYVKAVAGFVPYPILVNEDETKTVIFSAEAKTNEIEAYKNIYGTAVVYQDEMKIGLETVIEPQDIGISSQILQEELIPVKMEKDGVTYTGAFSRFTPRDSVIASIGSVIGGEGSTYYIRRENQSLEYRQLRWVGENHPLKISGISPSVTRSLFSRIYFKGILIPELNVRLMDANGVPRGRITLNLTCESNEVIPTLSRKSINISEEHISKALSKNLESFVHQKYYEQLINSSPLERLILLARISRYICNNLIIKEILPIPEWPIAILEITGKINIILLKDAPIHIDIVPKYFLQTKNQLTIPFSIKENIELMEFTNAEYLKLNNPMAISSFGFESNDGATEEWKALDSILTFAIENHYQVVGLRIQTRTDSDLDLITLKAKQETHKVEKVQVWGTFQQPHIKFIEFEPIESNILCVLPLGWGRNILKNHLHNMLFNSNNPVGKLLMRALEAAKNGEALLDPVKLGKLKDAFHNNVLINSLRPWSPNNTNNTELLISGWAVNFCLTVAEYKLISLSEQDRLELENQYTVIVCRE